MLLAINVNNTNTSFGLHTHGRWIVHWRVATDRAKQSDEYAMLLRNLFDYSALEWTKISGVALSSVVPPITSVFVDLSRRYLGHEPLVVTHQLKTGVKILIDHPAEAGADRILNALGARTIHGCPCIVVDFLITVLGGPMLMAMTCPPKRSFSCKPASRAWCRRDSR